MSGKDYNRTIDDGYIHCRYWYVYEYVSGELCKRGGGVSIVHRIYVSSCESVVHHGDDMLVAVHRINPEWIYVYSNYDITDTNLVSEIYNVYNSLREF